MKLPAIILAGCLSGLLLSGCATSTLNNLTKDDNCTTKIKGHLAFGSITPTGDLDVSAVCTHPSAPKATEVAPPLAPGAVVAPTAPPGP